MAFRNCITKFAIFYPTLGQNLKVADYQHTQEVLIEEAEKKNPKIKAMNTDPWEKQLEKIGESFMNKQPKYIWELQDSNI